MPTCSDAALLLLATAPTKATKSLRRSPSQSACAVCSAAGARRGARPAGDPADVMISPRLGRLGWFDFHRAEEAIAIGAEAAEKSIEALTEAINALSEPCDGNGAAK